MITADASLQPVILAGMHRSGTSLAASVVQAAGLDVGERLLGQNIGNERGHFEDLDFIEFHKAVLTRNGLHWNGWTTADAVPVSEAETATARRLVAEKAARGHSWGWKDPRTTLFLDFWKAIAPGARFVFLYRTPWEVVDSLFRRGSDADVLSADPARALDYWLHYNQLLVKFVRANRERCAVVSNDALVSDAAKFLRVVGLLAGQTFKRPAKELYDPTLMRRDVSGSRWPAAFARLTPACIGLLHQLEEIADMPGGVSTAAPADDEVMTRLLMDQYYQASQRQMEQRTLLAEMNQLRYIGYEKVTQLAKLQEHVASMELAISEHRTHLTNVEEMLSETRRHAGNLEALMAERDTQILRLTTQSRDREAVIAELNAAILTLQQNEAGQCTHIANLDAAHRADELKNAELGRALQEHAALAAQLQAASAQQEAEILTLKNAQAGLEKDLLAARAHGEQLALQLSESHLQMAQRERTSAEAQAHAEKQIAALHAEVAQLGVENQRLTDHTADLAAKLTHLQRDLVEAKRVPVMLKRLAKRPFGGDS